MGATKSSRAGVPFKRQLCSLSEWRTSLSLIAQEWFPWRRCSSLGTGSRPNRSEHGWWGYYGMAFEHVCLRNHGNSLQIPDEVLEFMNANTSTTTSSFVTLVVSITFSTFFFHFNLRLSSKAVLPGLCENLGTLACRRDLTMWFVYSTGQATDAIHLDPVLVCSFIIAKDPGWASNSLAS
jgi:hypothetical protein